MRKLFGLILILFPLLTFSQNGITFEVEKLTKPNYLLRLTPREKIYENLIKFDLNIYQGDLNEQKTKIPYNIVAQSHLSDSLVTYDYHSFFEGMYQAYSNHRPFVLSPDMVWLLISQGFAQHINTNSEELRKYFVNFDGKETLIVENNSIDLKNPQSPWEEVFPEFTKKISFYIGEDLVNTLTCDFTTTTNVSRIASQITIMEGMKSYFEFIVLMSGCGIPEITLEGTPEDWQKVFEKTEQLRKYKLDWWIDELSPVLKEFVKASKGNVNKHFWQTMFRYHTQKRYGAPNIIDGWIVKFYPYDKDGKRNNLKKIIGTDKLPKEIVKVDLTHIELKENGTTIKTPLELWAGFVGLQQNSITYALKPEIGWMIRKKDIDNKGLVDRLNSEGSFGIMIRVKTVPKEILDLNHIKDLDITFIDNIQIPDEMSKITIDEFRMTGKISNSEIERICKLLPNTTLIINYKTYNAR